MGIDFGGFGKEFAVDRVIEIAQEHNIKDIIVNFGGDFARALPRISTRFGSLEFSFGIKTRISLSSTIHLSANNLAVATSGNYQRFFELGGFRSFIGSSNRLPHSII